jgi:hypothetical protein
MLPCKMIRSWTDSPSLELVYVKAYTAEHLKILR